MLVDSDRAFDSDLTGEQRTSLAAIADTNRALYRAYLLNEQLREVFGVKGTRGRQLLPGVRRHSG